MVSRNHISVIQARGQRFVITDRPDERDVEDYLELLKEHHVRALVRVCDPSYKTDLITQAGIDVYDWGFDDGDPPPDEIVDKWLKLCSDTFSKAEDAIAVHCVAGLGRAPVLVAVALMERGMSAEDAVFFIRERRPGAINRKQLMYLRTYRRRSKGGGGGKCVVM